MRRFTFLLVGILLFATQAIAQRTVSGRVTDNTGAPIPNASVTIKGTTTGTTTNEQGIYTIQVPANARTLVVSSVNMETQEISIGNQSTINVSLRTTESVMQEVVVVAYGTQKRADLTGSVATVKATDIENKPFTSPDKLLQGLVPGLQSVATSGQPGASQSILIRGVSSITASNGPLWVIDGVPVNTGDASRLQTTANLLSTINPNDIESISVLKDAASTAIYGSRGGNGVILVTTKKGKAGKTKFRLDAEVGMSDVAYMNDKYRPLNANEYFTILREGLVNAGASQTTINNTLNGLGFGNGIDFNWYDATTRTGTQQQYNLSAEGGSDKTTFYLSGGFFKAEGTTINSKMDRINLGTRIGHAASDKLSFNFNVNGGYVNQRAPLAGGAFGNPLISTYFLLPSRTAYNPDGSYNLNAASLGGLHNTVALAEIDKRFLREGSVRGNLSGEYKILRSLIFKTSLAGDFNMLEEDQYNNPFHGDGAASTGRAFSFYTRYMNKAWTNTLDWMEGIGRDDDLRINAQVGYESQSSRGYFSSVQSQSFPLTFDLTYPASGATPITSSATISDYTFISQFASASLNYMKRYIVSGSFRRDGSSRFGPNNKYGTFWSVGASWNLDEEAFIRNISFINQLKLRASYGVTGNAGIGNYEWAPSYSFGSTYNGQPGSAPSNVGDYNLTWELIKPFDVGIDMSVLQNRLNITADYYIRKSEDLLLDVPLSPTTGFGTATRNIGSMENRGIELAINAYPVQNANVVWNIDFNFAHNKNKVLSLPGGNEIISGTFIIREGLPIQTWYVREYAGVDPANGDPLWYVDETKSATTNVYSQAKLIAQPYTSLPKYFGSLTNMVSFKGFSLDAQLYYNFGNYSRDSWGGYYLGAGFGATFNKVARVLDRWTQPGDQTMIPRYVHNGNRSFHSFSTFWLNQGDFIRLRNVQLGYTVPRNIISRINLTNMFFYVRGTNLYTWVKDENLPWDPEQGTNSSSNLNVYIPKTMTVGVNLTF